MISINADRLQDGLYQIQDGHIHKYKANGGFAIAYEIGEIVRCRDCKYNPWKPTANVECVWDDDWAEREQTLDDFCSYGVREDGEEE